MSLPLFCAFCGGALELMYEAAGNQDTLLSASYECPRCREINLLKIPGRVLWVTERDAKQDVKTRSKLR